jgi:hypothetical protein
MAGPEKSDSLDFEKVSLDDARKALDDSVKPAGPTVARASVDFANRRAPQPAETMRTSTIQWILRLPPHLQPRHLQVKYPRIANRLASLWPEPARCEPYLDDLLTDKRGGRKGFPLAVAQEIASLRDYYFRLHHKGLVAWDHVEMGR